MDECLRWMIDEQVPITAEAVGILIKAEPEFSRPRDAQVDEVDLVEYDELCADWQASAEEWEVGAMIAKRPCL